MKQKTWIEILPKRCIHLAEDCNETQALVDTAMDFTWNFD